MPFNFRVFPSNATVSGSVTPETSPPMAKHERPRQRRNADASARCFMGQLYRSARYPFAYLPRARSTISPISWVYDRPALRAAIANSADEESQGLGFASMT